VSRSKTLGYRTTTYSVALKVLQKIEEWIRKEQPETIDKLWNEVKDSEYSKILIGIYPELKE